MVRYVYMVCVEICIGLWCVCMCGVVFRGVRGMVCMYGVCWMCV